MLEDDANAYRAVNNTPVSGDAISEAFHPILFKEYMGN